MYNNIGNKLKVFAVVIFVLTAVAGFILGLVFLRSAPAAGIIMMIIYPLIGWLTSLSIYGIGESVDIGLEIKEKLDRMSYESSESQRLAHNDAILKSGGWQCMCGTVNAHYIYSCACGRNKNQASAAPHNNYPYQQPTSYSVPQVLMPQAPMHQNMVTPPPYGNVGVVKPINADPAHNDALLRSGGWRCRCGTVHASYVSSCGCGMSKRDIM